MIGHPFRRLPDLLDTPDPLGRLSGAHQRQAVAKLEGRRLAHLLEVVGACLAEAVAEETARTDVDAAESSLDRVDLGVNLDQPPLRLRAGKGSDLTEDLIDTGEELGRGLVARFEQPAFGERLAGQRPGCPSEVGPQPRSGRAIGIAFLVQTGGSNQRREAESRDDQETREERQGCGARGDAHRFGSFEGF